MGTTLCENPHGMPHQRANRTCEMRITASEAGRGDTVFTSVDVDGQERKTLKTSLVFSLDSPVLRGQGLIRIPPDTGGLGHGS